MGGIGCVVTVDQVEIDSVVVNVLIPNEELSVVDIGPTNESATVPSSVPLLASSVRVLTIVMFGRVIRLLISRFQLFIVYP
jgi:hypothetical protein